MPERDSWRKLASSDLGVLVLWATAGVLLHTVTNGQYGFHHDELATLDDARSLAWGYVAYPPLTPFLARIAFILFGPSLIGLRFFAAVAMGLVLVLTGLMARHLGGGRQAQIVAALAAAIGGVALSGGTLFQYVSFDYLWWVAAAYFMVGLLASDESSLLPPRAFPAAHFDRNQSTCYFGDRTLVHVPQDDPEDHEHEQNYVYNVSDRNLPVS